MADKPTYEELEQKVKELEKKELERQLVEKVLHESEAKYQDLYENAPDMFITVDAKTANILECNQTMANALGYTKEEIIGRPIFDMYTPDSAEYAKATVFSEFAKTGTIEDEELQVQRKDGSIIDVSLNVSAVHDEQGSILYSRSIWHDITKRKKAEEALQKVHDELEQRVEERTAELKEVNETLNLEIEEHKLAKSRILHLDRIFRSIQSINRLIMNEKDPDKLLQVACESCPLVYGD